MERLLPGNLGNLFASRCKASFVLLFFVFSLNFSFTFLLHLPRSVRPPSENDCGRDFKEIEGAVKRAGRDLGAGVCQDHWIEKECSLVGSGSRAAKYFAAAHDQLFLAHFLLEIMIPKKKKKRGRESDPFLFCSFCSFVVLGPRL